MGPPIAGGRTNPPKICVSRETGGLDSGCCGISGGVVVVVEGYSGGEDLVAVMGDAIKPRAWDLGHQSVTSELDDETGDAFASSVSLVGVVWGTAV
jgi:hypothetical protein